MNSFRITDTKFRILKGGKIGLAMSIALISGILSISSTSANAADEYSTTVDRDVNSDGSGFTVYNSSVDSVRVYASHQDSTDFWNGSSSVNTVEIFGYDSPDITISAGTNITGEARDTGADNTLMGIYSEYSFGGWDYDVTDLSNSTVSFSGNNDIRGLVGAKWLSYGGGSLQSDTIGTINLNDVDVVFHQAVDAHTININAGSNTTNTDDFTFYGDVTTNGDGSFVANTGSVQFNSAATVKFNGNVTGNIDFNGNDGVVTLAANKTITGSIDTSGVNGTLIFKGAGTVTGDVSSSADYTLKEVRADGTGNVLFTDTHTAEVDHVNYQAAALIGFNGGLDLSVDTSDQGVNTVTFNNHDGVLQINTGSLTGILNQAVVTTSGNNLGTVTMVSGSQTITGNIGSNGHAIKTLNIGGANSDGLDTSGNVYSTTTANGDIYAQNTYLNNNVTTNSSSLIMASGYNLNSTVTTNDANMGILTLAGGTQNVTGQVGTDTFRLAQVNSGAGALPGTPNANSTFESNVFAVTLNNTGTGTTNLNGNFTGTTLNFAQDGVVNLANNKTITASVTSAVDNTGTLTFVENGTMVGDIGTTHSLKLVNIGDATNTANASTVTTDSITATTTAINNNSTLVVRASEGITGNVTSETTGTGILNLTAGTNFVNGNIGTNSVALGTVTAGTTTYLNSAANTTTTSAMSYIDTLQYTGNGIVVLNGTNSANAIGGMKGTVDFGTNVTNTGTLQIGDTVNLTTGTTGIQFADANGATLTFNGSSTINGDMGSLSGTDTFEVINGGAAGEIVTFNNNVYFIDSLNLSSTGTIEIADGKYAQRTTPGAIVTTSNNGQGVLDYLGGTTLYGDIGTTTDKLAAVNFNTEENGIVQEINYDVYATNTTVGHTSSINDSSINLTDVTGQYDYAGATTIKEFRGQTAANITDDITFGGNLIISDAKSAINFGISHVTVSNDFTTNNGAMSFTVNTRDITGINQASSTNTGSAFVSVVNELDMTGSEKIHINYVGSLANNGSYTIVSAGVDSSSDYDQSEITGNLVTDNSFSIDTKVVEVIDGTTSDLVVYADRTSNGSYNANELYVQKSDTNGHFSNNAAVALAGISANGNQTDDMIEVIQKLELDSFGYGNSKENLAVQVQKLAPIVNTSFAQTSISATKLVTDTVGSRLSDTRGLSSGDAIADKGVWAKVIGSTASQDKVGQFDGYSLSSGGVVFGIDKELQNNTIIGLAAGYTNTKTEQDDFRDGDSSTTDSYQLSLYASKTFDKAYIDGALSYTKHNTDGTRSSAIGREASYDVDANQLSAKINGGYNFLFENEVTLTPFASLEYSNIKQDSYKEEGAGAISLSVDDVTVNRGAAGLGVKISKEIKTEDNVVYIPEFKLGANKYFGDEDVEVTAQFDQGNKFVTKGAEMSDMMYNAGLGVKTKFTEDTSVSLSTDYERSNDGDFQGVNGQLTFRMQF